MKTIKIAAALSVLCLPLAVLSGPAIAATAHNSQAGAAGPTTNDDAGTGMVKRQKQMMKKPMKAKKAM